MGLRVIRDRNPEFGELAIEVEALESEGEFAKLQEHLSKMAQAFPGNRRVQILQKRCSEAMQIINDSTEKAARAERAGRLHEAMQIWREAGQSLPTWPRPPAEVERIRELLPQYVWQPWVAPATVMAFLIVVFVGLAVWAAKPSRSQNTDPAQVRWEEEVGPRNQDDGKLAGEVVTVLVLILCPLIFIRPAERRRHDRIGDQGGRGQGRL